MGTAGGHDARVPRWTPRSRSRIPEPALGDPRDLEPDRQLLARQLASSPPTLAICVATYGPSSSRTGRRTRARARTRAGAPRPMLPEFMQEGPQANGRTLRCPVRGLGPEFNPGLIPEPRFSKSPGSADPGLRIEIRTSATLKAPRRPLLQHNVSDPSESELERPATTACAITEANEAHLNLPNFMAQNCSAHVFDAPKRKFRESGKNSDLIPSDPLSLEQGNLTSTQDSNFCPVRRSGHSLDCATIAASWLCLAVRKA